MPLELTPFFGVVAFIVVCLFLFLSSKFQEAKRATTVPGMGPSDPKTGNLTDIVKATSLHQFLTHLHNKYGPIASYWLGKQLAVSIASAELFKQHIGVFDRPGVAFGFLELILGSKALGSVNGEDGKMRRRAFEPCHSHTSVMAMYPIFNKEANYLAEEWSSMVGDTHIPLTDHMYSYSLKTLSKASYGNYFNDDDKVKNLRKAYEDLFFEIDKHLDAKVPEEGTADRKILDEAIKNMDDIAHDVVEYRLAHPPSGGEYLLIDAMLELDTGEQTIGDLVEYFIGGYHSAGTCLTWAIYFLTRNPDTQDRAAQEVLDVLGEEDVDAENSAKLVYLRQVIDETIRCSVLTPYAARYSPDNDEKLGGHVIPAGTPVMHALGVVMQDPIVWPDPERFDPDRFSQENTKNRPPLAYSPFGFAGKRKCPGYRFAYAEMTVLLAVILRRYRIKLVGDPDVKRVFRLVTTPSEEIWVTIEERKG